MKKIFSLLLLSVLIFSMAACGQEQPSALGDIPSVESAPVLPAAPASDTDISSPAGSPVDASPQVSKIPEVDDSETMDAYMSFLEENYEGLYDACYGGIAGIGFIDLDCDGYREMLMFDAGASASMGVQFFDIADGKVECVSANMQPMGDAFGGSHFTKAYVNTNYFEDFRLVEDVNTGERFFLVESSNGSIDFSYRELIRFGRDKDDVLTLSPMFYIYEEYDEETGNVTFTRCRIDNSDCSIGEYNSASTAFFGSIVDLGLEAGGVFAWSWSNGAQPDGRDSFLQMAGDAAALSENNFISR